MQALPTVEEIIDRLARLSMTGKTIRLTPRTATMVELALRQYLALSRRDDDNVEIADPGSPPQKEGLHPLIFRIDLWDKGAVHIVGTLAWLSNLTIAVGSFAEFCLEYPFDRLTLRHGAYVLREQEWSDRYATDATTLAKVAAWRARHRPVAGWRDGWGDEDASGVPLADPAETMLVLPAPREET